MRLPGSLVALFQRRYTRSPQADWIEDMYDQKKLGLHAAKKGEVQLVQFVKHSSLLDIARKCLE